MNWKKYILALAITAVIFSTAMYASSYFNGRKLKELQAIQDKIALDILSSETQFDLLQEASCKDVNNSILSEELNSLSSKLDYMEGQRGAKDVEVAELKRYYSLLQIKDYLLMNRMSEKCGIEPLSILYFYSNEGDCEACEKEGYTLTYLRRKYPQLRIYSFDYNLDIAAVRTLLSIHQITKELPALVIKGSAYYGYKDEAAIEKVMPELAKLALDMNTQKDSDKGTSTVLQKVKTKTGQLLNSKEN